MSLDLDVHAFVVGPFPPTDKEEPKYGAPLPLSEEAIAAHRRCEADINTEKARVEAIVSELTEIRSRIQSRAKAQWSELGHIMPELKGKNYRISDDGTQYQLRMEDESDDIDDLLTALVKILGR